jgi:calcineurin-like phosphoesterase family protein
MSKSYFISDYHFGHAKVIQFEEQLRGKVLGVDNIDDHDALLMFRTWTTVNKRDTLWVLGDNGSVDTTVELVKNCKGIVRYVPGNHDKPANIAILGALDNVIIHGITKWKNFWITHAPVHDQELRGCLNIHGHSHSKVIRDARYVCVSVENTEGYPIWGEDIRSGAFQTYQNFIS